MNFKKFISISTMVLIVSIISLLGFSYAWYVASNVQTNIGLKTSSSDKINVEFVTGEYINTSVGIPILDSEVADKAERNTFTIIAKDTMTVKANYNIYIDEISIADELKNSSDFRWELLREGTKVSEGNFSTVENNRINLYTTSLTLNTTIPDSYELRVWLRENNDDQNALMGKTFTGRIKVDVYMVR